MEKAQRDVVWMMMRSQRGIGLQNQFFYKVGSRYLVRTWRPSTWQLLGNFQ